ncbi:MAG: MBL fold metallo-hydrolase [Thermoprotei archaeon]|nr:MAG: MBL fold metallo-hydrolase [Thermoprotei archaeon]
MSSGLKIRVLGGARRVGKSAILVSSRESSVLLDYGVDISGEEPDFPLHVRPKELDLIALSHAHLDHSGAIPLLYVSARPKLYATPLTIALSDILINDFLKISKYYIPYEANELRVMRKAATPVKPGDVVEEDDFQIRFHEAGHIPGSTMIELEIEGYSVLYTGDFNTVETCLLKKACLKPFEKADVVIMEATYAEYDHPERRRVEERFVEDLVEVLDSGGTVLIPAFAVGRSQEIMCVLAKYGIDYPVYVDGMARRVNTVLLEQASSLRDPKLFRRACSVARSINGWRDRRRAASEPSVIVSPAAMLKGGASVYYMKTLLDDPRNAIFFVSYLIRETPARKLLETGVFEHETLKKAVRARVEWYDFSSHCGRRELREVLRRLKRGAKLIIVHSEEEVGLKFTKWIREEVGLEVEFPREGEEVKFSV